MPNKEQKKGCDCYELEGILFRCAECRGNSSPEKVKEEEECPEGSKPCGVTCSCPVKLSTPPQEQSEWNTLLSEHVVSKNTATTPTPKQEDWEKEWEKQWGWLEEKFTIVDWSAVKDFIHQTLLTQREEIIREIGEKMPTIRAENDNNPYIIGREEYCSEVKSLLKDLKNRV